MKKEVDFEKYRYVDNSCGIELKNLVQLYQICDNLYHQYKSNHDESIKEAVLSLIQIIRSQSFVCENISIFRRDNNLIDDVEYANNVSMCRGIRRKLIDEYGELENHQEVCMDDEEHN